MIMMVTAMIMVATMVASGAVRNTTVISLSAHQDQGAQVKRIGWANQVRADHPDLRIDRYNGAA
ncbi:hypothetical protein C4E44_07250 [Pseudomonas sp. MWU12-2312b]|nr:hypothetical protein C4E44_07250 [Pseudomonas sp. MWU12-2312b]